MRFTIFLTLLLPLTFFIGCSGNSNPFGTVHVEGMVTFDGNPVEGVNVNLISRDGEHSAGGLTGANGRFTVATSGFNGAKPGSYDVIFSKIELPGQDLSPEEFNRRFGNRQPEPTYVIPQRYESPQTSGIEPITVSTDRRQNVFTFDLRSE
jgi:hypothetical protein